MLAWHFEEMIISEEWEKEWLSVDRDQLIELLKSNDLVLPSNFYRLQIMLLMNLINRSFLCNEKFNKLITTAWNVFILF